MGDYMKRTVVGFLFFVLSALVLVSCATAPKYSTFVSVKGAQCPQAQFAAEEIASSLAKVGVGISDADPEWTIRFAEIDPSLGAQAYHIEVLGKIIEITGGDERGLMYGGLEVAEQARLYGLDSIKESEGRPFRALRGTKFNIPLDMRTPSYSDRGDSGQQNIDDMWDIGFWHRYIDFLARNRYNAISIWNLNPFPSMVKVPEYPDVALDDVWRVNSVTDKGNGNATDMVIPEFFEDYSVIKKMTIDEKIAFWQSVMQYAADRGIDFYIYTWNVYTFGEQGKYGITSDMDNETTLNYYRCAVREMVKTYPLLKGIGLTSGENMGFDIGSERCETWLFNTYGLGINDALKEDPSRDFTLLHRTHYADFNIINKVWSAFSGHIEYSSKYSGDHMYSNPRPLSSDGDFRLAPEGSTIYLEIRNDEMYNLRYSDSEFIREYLSKMPDGGKLGGFLMGSDSSVPGIAVKTKDAFSDGELFMERHWINYMEVGRLGYDINLSKERISDILSDYFGVDGAALLELMNTVAKVVPTTVQCVWFPADYSWYPEGNCSDPNSFGYYGVSLMMKNEKSHPASNYLPVGPSAVAKLKGEDTSKYVTAFDAVDMLREYSDTALSMLKTLRAKKPSAEAADEYNLLLDCQEAMALLGLYYADKIEGAALLRMYNDSSDTAYQQQSIAVLTQGLEHWKQYAAIYDRHYNDELLVRVGWNRISEREAKVQKDIETVSKWRIKTIK